MKYILISLIRLYRFTLSPLIGNQCRFQPTCSHYGEGAIQKYGSLKGSWLTIKRIFKCGPWHKGGYDPIP